MSAIEHLFDPVAALVVLCGTLLATVARSGRAESAITLRQLLRLARPRFDEPKVRASLARLIARMQSDGVIRTEVPQIADRELSDATMALIRDRSIAAMRMEHERHRATRERHRAIASLALGHAADVAPVFGLAGTLLALSQLPSDLGETGAFADAVSTAVVSTLYGLVLAHLLCVPLARAIERAGTREEDARDTLVDWLAEQVEPACPRKEYSYSHAERLA